MSAPAMLPRRIRHLSLFCAAVLTALILIPAAQANFARRFWGDVNTEPWGLKEVAIVHEQLTIDLRPLAALRPAHVEVVYDLSNSGASKRLDLLFVSGELGVRDFEAHLGNEPVPARLLAPKELRRHWDRFPANWRPPESAPGIDVEKAYFVRNGWDTEATPVEFSLELPPGPSTLRVRYRARACGADEGYPTATWQFPYILAPAREWGEFGRLDVVVKVPDGCQARSTPPLEREGATLRGSFSGLPADILLLATRAPAPAEYYWAAWISAALFILTVLGGGIFCWWAGRWQGLSAARLGITEKGAGKLVATLLAIPLSVLWGAAVFVAGEIIPQALMRAPLHGQERPDFHEAFDVLFYLCSLFASSVAILCGIAITQWSASRAARRASARVSG
jgi:hypothetical protein